MINPVNRANAYNFKLGEKYQQHHNSNVSATSETIKEAKHLRERRLNNDRRKNKTEKRIMDRRQQQDRRQPVILVAV